MSRVPIRLRLTLAFAAAIAVVVAGGGWLFYHHLASSLDQTLDQGLRARSADVAALISQADPGLREAPPAPVAAATGTFAQVLDSRGRIHDETRGLGSQPLLDPSQLARARDAPLTVERVHRLGTDVRLLAGPVPAQGQRFVLVVGAPLQSRDESLANVRDELLVGGPFALLLVCLIGYLVAGAALRPVERMRARAASITDEGLSERLPVPPARDEIARLGTTLNELLGRLERSVTRERGFIADASHELRAPLSLIRAEVDVAFDAPRTPGELEAALRSIGEEADRLSQLADDLLLLARFDEGELRLRREPVDAPVLLHDVAARFRRRTADSGRTFEVQATDVEVEADRLRLEQAIVNLVENALRHGAGTVRLTATPVSGGVEFEVSDEGAGFADGVADTAFGRFTRGDAARSSTGAGLGLAIVDAIAKAHGGGVAIRPAGGGRVVLTLPAVAAARTAQPPARAGEAVTSSLT